MNKTEEDAPIVL